MSCSYKSILKIIFIFLISFLVFAFLLNAENKRTTVQNTKDFYQNAAKPYKGITLYGLSESEKASVYIKEVLAPQFEKETGIKIDLQLTGDWYLLYNKTIADIDKKSSKLDFIYTEQDYIYAFMEKDRLVNLSAILDKHPELKSPEFKISRFTSFVKYFMDNKEQLYGIPIESFLFVYLYRKDLFNDPMIGKAFFAEYDYPLSPAITFQQYLDNAKFFTEYGKKHHLNLWGTTLQGVQPTVHEAS